MQDEQQVMQQEQEQLSNKELNFRKQEQAFLKKIEEERQARLQLEQKLAEIERQKNTSSYQDDEEDDYSDPYVDKKKLKKELSRLKQETVKTAQSDIQRAVQQALYEERKNNWIKSNQDFYDIMQHAEKLYQKDPEFAETILEMPDSFERQKLVYKSIKALRLHEKEQPKSTIQDTIESKRRGPYYQPSSMASSPYSNGGDFSPTGQKSAYDKMMQLKSQLRLG